MFGPSPCCPGLPAHQPEFAFPTIRYPHVLEESFKFERLKSRELSIQGASIAFRELPDWTEKLEDRNFVAEWLRERLESNIEDSLRSPVWNREDITYWFGELKKYKNYIETIREEGVSVEPATDGVWKSHRLMDENLRQALIDATKTLELAIAEVPFPPTWLPSWAKTSPPPPRPPFPPLSPPTHQWAGIGCLLEPSMYPIAYNQTLTFKNGEFTKISPPDGYRVKDYDHAYCWLPSELDISKDGKRTKIVSYINNLSKPEEEELFYPLLQTIFTNFIPLFDHCLAEMAEGIWHQSRCKVYRHLTKDRSDNSTDWNLKFSPHGWYRPKLYTPKLEYLETYRKLLHQFRSGENMSFDIVKWQGKINWDGDDLQKQEDQVLVANPWDLPPERMWAPPTLSSDTTLKGKRVKVFVRIAHIELIPERPEWGGGKWSLAGWINERIVANGIYCYSRENITETHLALRRKKHSLIVNSIQEIEPISVKENGAIVYTNIYESRIAPFNLVDRTKPGSLKLLVFHLCDPNADLPTTRDIIPQQPGAYEQVLRKSRLGLLPEDVFNLILQELETPRMSTAVPRSHRSILPTNNTRLPLEDSDSEDFGVGIRNSYGYHGSLSCLGENKSTTSGSTV
ncbi:hypothetical protein TWF173_003118 [Orbilia oligospora]|nr:hypothetical protein TWF173_003118 [Orbilia oligospora]